MSSIIHYRGQYFLSFDKIESSPNSFELLENIGDCDIRMIFYDSSQNIFVFTSDELRSILNLTDKEAIIIVPKKYNIEGTELKIIIRDPSFVSKLLLVLPHVTFPKISPRQFYTTVINNGCNQILQTFPSQDLAFQHHDKLMQNGVFTHLFSFESVITRKRKFLVADYKTFVHRYLQLSPDHRHVYEIIRDGYPCRAYFDLEYTKSLANSHVDGEQLTTIWIGLVISKIKEIFGLRVDHTNVVELDSSTHEKFSRHIIIVLRVEGGCEPGGGEDGSEEAVVRCPRVEGDVDVSSRRSSSEERVAVAREKCKGGWGQPAKTEWLFPNNLSVGKLVTSILKDMLQPLPINTNENESENASSPSAAPAPPPKWADFGLPREFSGMEPKPEFSKFWVISKSEGLRPVVLDADHTSPAFDPSSARRTCFVDLGVYTRNRVFRILKSSKLGKSCALSVCQPHPDRKGVGSLM